MKINENDVGIGPYLKSVLLSFLDLHSNRQKGLNYVMGNQVYLVINTIFLILGITLKPRQGFCPT